MSDGWRTISTGGLAMMNQMAALQSTVGGGIRKPDTAATNGFDPYQAMLKRRQRGVEGDSSDYKQPEVVQHASEDVKALEEFCQQYGILGFNCGRMSPRAALQMLKSRIGVKDAVVPQSAKRQMLNG